MGVVVVVVGGVVERSRIENEDSDKKRGDAAECDACGPVRSGRLSWLPSLHCDAAERC